MDPGIPSPLPSPTTWPYLEGREAKACGLASSTEVEGSSHDTKQCSGRYHSPHACHHRWSLRGHHRPLQIRKASRPGRPGLSTNPLAVLLSPTPVHHLLTGCRGARRGLARAWMMPLNAMMSHTTTWLTTTAPGACRKTRVRPSR